MSVTMVGRQRKESLSMKPYQFFQIYARFVKVGTKHSYNNFRFLLSEPLKKYQKGKGN